MGYQLTPAQKRLILERDGYICQYCGKQTTAVDHVIPWKETEDSSPGNIVTCCPSCNRYGNDKIFDSFEEKRAYILGRRNSGRGRKRVIDPDIIDAVFAPTEKSSHLSPYDVKYKRHTYRIKAETHEGLKGIAEQSGIGVNDLVRWIFRNFIQEYEKGEISLPVQEYVVTRLILSD